MSIGGGRPRSVVGQAAIAAWLAAVVWTVGSLTGAAPRPEAKPSPPALKVGRFQTKFEQHSPYSNSSYSLPRLITRSELTQLTRDRQGNLPAHSYQIAEETFEVYVPEAYDGKTP